GNSIDDFSIKNTGSKLEGTIDRWASEVLRVAPAPAAALQEAVLTDLTAVGESAALFTDVRPIMVQGLLRHAMTEVISDGIINSVVVTNSANANLEYMRMHERDPTAAAVWRRHTFSAAVEVLTPEMMRMIFEDNMPSLAALLPDSAEDPLGTRSVLQDAFQFSRMLHGAPTRAGADADALYRSFVLELASTLYPRQVEAVKRCHRSEHGEGERVGAIIFPGLVEIWPAPSGKTYFVNFR
ncbi:hypothetical protein H4582DRAFT_1818637, partial [Lactarius indigo]